MSKATQKTLEKANNLGIKTSSFIKEARFHCPSSIFNLENTIKNFLSSLGGIERGIFTGTHDDCCYYEITRFKTEEELLKEIEEIEQNLNSLKQQEIIEMKKLISKYKEEALDEVNK